MTELLHALGALPWYTGLTLLWVLLGVMSLVAHIMNRILRSINIAIRGWPPAHLDAEGDHPECDCDEKEEVKHDCTGCSSGCAKGQG